MPGVHSLLGAIERGVVQRSLFWIKGGGIHPSCVGVYGSWKELSMMKIVDHADKEEKGVVCTIEVDMIEKRAKHIHIVTF